MEKETTVLQSGAAEVTGHCGGLNVREAFRLEKLMMTPVVPTIPELPAIRAVNGSRKGALPVALKEAVTDPDDTTVPDGLTTVRLP